MADGYAGFILFCNLTDGSIRRERLPEDWKTMYLGGNGFAARILYAGVKPHTDPLSPENTLVFAVGPATGTLLSTSSRFVVAAKSPLTGLFFDSYCGGHWAPELKYAGYDAVVIEGAAEKPVYLHIQDDSVSLKDASHLWGLDTEATQKTLARELKDPRVQVACIGPGGERGVRYGAIMAGNRMAGRGGMGAVMGAKKLKAVAVAGTKGAVVARPKELFNLFADLEQKFQAHPSTGKQRPRYGTTSAPSSLNALGALGTHNWQTELFDGAENISGESWIQKGYLVKDKVCMNCSIRCGKVWGFKEGPNQGMMSRGPEYESIFSLGSSCGVDSFAAILKAERLCNLYGFDTISAGGSIAFAMECFQRGLIGPSDTGGLDLSFGNGETLVELVRLIGEREGIGKLLGEGTRRAAEVIGGDARKYAIEIKGLEPAGHSPRALKGMALGYATSPRGGSHHDTRPTLERSGAYDRTAVVGKGKMARANQDYTAVGDSLIICRFTESVTGSFVNEIYADMVKVVTGWDLSVDELKELGERIYNLERVFNAREGSGRHDDRLPLRFMTEPIPQGPSKGMYVPDHELDLMLDEYYEDRGWNPVTGNPTTDTLQRLGLEELVKKHG